MNRLLVIDDDPTLAAFVVRAAKSLGFETVQTDDPALFLKHAAEWAPTVAVIDLLMPKVDGVQLIRALADMHSKTQIVLASGMDARTIDTVRRLGESQGLKIAGILAKPMRLQALRDMLQPLFIESQDVTADMLREAIATKALTVHYQPKLSLESLQMVGVEALARWVLPSGRSVPPDVFIRLAESTDQIDDLTDQVVDIAVQQAAAWRGSGLELPVSVAVNISALNLRRRELPERILATCKRAGLPPDALTLEITETATMNDAIMMMEVLTRLRIQGFKLSLDDFGTGYSSMVQLVRLPFTEIKIDRSFVAEMERVSDSATVAKLVVDLGHSLGLKVTAEGIETQTACAMLREFGCDLGQGYLFSKPAPADAIPKLAWAGATKPTAVAAVEESSLRSSTG
jgi:EAL domain-containing protein (putative c-di-GMP-specific phosphodiesterase class I)